ncbi:hypothetical protein [Corynebacterium belfantii]|uniref:hypothetical protein n=1 Tax=Corynebacterium belfantii TaxID=2014537 RepID=UPI0035A8F123
MSSFPGRRIVPNGDGFDWYMNPEGCAYKVPTQPVVATQNLIPVQGRYDGRHTVYRHIPQRFSLADVLLFHPDTTTTITTPYFDGISQLLRQLPDGESISSECSERVAQLSAHEIFDTNQFPIMQSWINDHSGDNLLSVDEKTVAIGIGRVILNGSTTYSLLPMCSTASGYATLCRLIEELLMIAVLFEQKRTKAAICSRELALRLFRIGKEQYGANILPGIRISLLAHLARRSAAPMAPRELPIMMEQVAKQIEKLKAIP